jgi:hypothetical protein
MKHRSETMKRDGAKTGALVSRKTQLVSPRFMFRFMQFSTHGFFFSIPEAVGKKTSIPPARLFIVSELQC